MDAYVTEEQQVEAIKNWFNKHGNTLSWIVIAVLSVVLAVKYWLHHQQVVYQQASDTYAAMIFGLDSKDDVTVKAQAEKLLKEHPTSPYATFAAFALANEAIKENNLEVAQTQLEWVMNHAKQPDFRALARLRLMRLFIAQNKLSEALGLYDEQKGKTYLPIMAELKGDILLKQNDQDGARKAYEHAFQLAPKEDMVGVLLKVKLEELGVDPSSLSNDMTKTKAEKS